MLDGKLFIRLGCHAARQSERKVGFFPEEGNLSFVTKEMLCLQCISCTINYFSHQCHHAFAPGLAQGKPVMQRRQSLDNQELVSMLILSEAFLFFSTSCLNHNDDLYTRQLQ